MINDHHQLSYSVKYKKCPNVYIVITQKSENPYIGHRLYPCRKIRVTHERISYTKLVTGKSRGSIIKDRSILVHNFMHLLKLKCLTPCWILLYFSKKLYTYKIKINDLYICYYLRSYNTRKSLGKKNECD